MAASQGPTSAAYRAADEARRLEHSWIGPEHVLLALFAEPSPATGALEELGVTRDLVEEAARRRSDPPPPPYRPWRGRRRARVDGEEGIDLEDAVATARQRAASS